VAKPKAGAPAPGRHLESLCYESLARPVLKCQSRQLFQCPKTNSLVYNKDSNDADETVLMVGPLALREPVVSTNASKALSTLMAPSTPLEYLMEVVPC